MNPMVSGAPVILRAADSLPRSPEELHKQFLSLYNDERVIVDLTGVQLVDVGLLAELAQLRVHRHTKRLLLGRLIVDSQQVRNALSAVGFERHWPIFHTLPEALASFDGPPLYA